MDDLIDPTDPKLYEMADVHTAEVKDGELVFKRENKPMTIDERAQKLGMLIAALLNFHVYRQADQSNLDAVIQEIVDQFREVERDGYQRGTKNGLRVTAKRAFNEGFEEGIKIHGSLESFHAARDKAAGVMKKCALSCPHCEDFLRGMEP